tara:strand:- start:1652 stop:2152 length:501 start_codon:yes stop_codon:yes gene_type:complete
MIRYILLILILFTNQKIFATEILGQPKVIDGDTIYIDNYKIRLEGIDAPEIKQRCKKPYLKISAIIGFTLNKNYSCGIISKNELMKKIQKSKVKCITTSRDRYKRYLATCFKSNINLNQWMVRNGYAVAYKRYSKRYLPDEKIAKENKLGVWQGSFIRPEKWRKLN